MSREERINQEIEKRLERDEINERYEEMTEHRKLKRKLEREHVERKPVADLIAAEESEDKKVVYRDAERNEPKEVAYLIPIEGSDVRGVLYHKENLLHEDYDGSGKEKTSW